VSIPSQITHKESLKIKHAFCFKQMVCKASEKLDKIYVFNMRTSLGWANLFHLEKL
jgi:hypothetical protein